MGVNGTNVGSELERLQRFRTPHERADLPDGGHVWLRQLSPADALLLDAADPEAGVKTLALCLCTEDGERLFSKHNIADGVAMVGDWPFAYIDAMNPVLARLNPQPGTVDDPLAAARQD